MEALSAPDRIRDANGYVHMNPPRNLAKERLEAGVNTCIAFMLGFVGFAFSVALFNYTQLGSAIGVLLSLLFCLYYSFKASKNGGNGLAFGVILVLADLAFLTGMFIMASMT